GAGQPVGDGGNGGDDGHRPPGHRRRQHPAEHHDVGGEDGERHRREPVEPASLDGGVADEAGELAPRTGDEIGGDGEDRGRGDEGGGAGLPAAPGSRQGDPGDGEGGGHEEYERRRG